MSISTIIRRYTITLTLAVALHAQTPVTPMQNPHPVFNDVTGLACAGCSLYSYAAGSTTPQPTYTDSSGSVQNTNPVILGQDGGPLTPSGSSGAIWMGMNAYKFVLVNASAMTVFTVDNVAGGGSFPCGPAYAIQAANASVTGFTCDAAITINTSTHALNVGTLPPNHVTIGALGTSTAWTFDTTTPATALASLGGGTVNPGTINQIAIYPSTGTAVSGSNAIPAGITAVTQPASTNNGLVATTAYVAKPGAINPTSLQVDTGVAMTANQGTGTAVQHSTGPTVTGNGAMFDATGNTVNSGSPIGIGTPAQLAGSRVLGTIYQNTATYGIDVSGNVTITGGGGDSTITCLIGTASPPTLTYFATTTTSTGSGNPVGFSCRVPAGYFYEVTFTNIISPTPGSWVETPN